MARTEKRPELRGLAALGGNMNDSESTGGEVRLERQVRPGLAFRVGDRVRLSTIANSYYGGVGRWTPVGQGGGTDGTVLYAGDRPHKPGADPSSGGYLSAMVSRPRSAEGKPGAGGGKLPTSSSPASSSPGPRGHGASQPRAESARTANRGVGDDLPSAGSRARA